MGGNVSTRKLTLVNDEHAGVIKLSESLAHRLRGQIENDKGIKKNENEVPAKPPPQYPITPPEKPVPPPVEPAPPIKEIPEPESVIPGTLQGQSESQGEEEIPAWSFYAREAHLLAAKLREEKDLALKIRDEEWRQRIKEREQEYVQVNKLTVDHMQDTLKEVEGLFTKVSCSPICQEQQNLVMKCYEDHPTQSLRCSDQVETFARCVNLSRFQTMMREKAS